MGSIFRNSVFYFFLKEKYQNHTNKSPYIFFLSLKVCSWIKSLFSFPPESKNILDNFENFH